MRKRSQSREYALKILYKIDITKDDPLVALEDFWKNQELEEDNSIKEFTTTLVNGVACNIKKIDEIIAKYATNWEINRMAVVDRNVLRCAIFELLFIADIPPKVTINEAVDIAKKFGDKDSGRFVNGVLDQIFRTEPKIAK